MQRGEKAMALFERTLATRPDNAAAHLALGRALAAFPIAASAGALRPRVRELQRIATHESGVDPEVACALADIDVPDNLNALPGFLAYATAQGIDAVVLATRPSHGDNIAAMKAGVSDFLISPSRNRCYARPSRRLLYAAAAQPGVQNCVPE
jgi:hypothetical protein